MRIDIVFNFLKNDIEWKVRSRKSVSKQRNKREENISTELMASSDVQLIGFL